MAESAVEISPLSRDVRARFATCLGLLAAYLAAVKNDPLTPFQLAFFGAAAAWSLGFEHRFRKPFFSAPIKIGLIALGAAIFVLFIAGNVSGTTEHFANSIARFLFWNAIVFILSRNKSEYDFWTLAIIQLSLFMLSGSFVQPPLFLPLLLVSVTCLLYTFQRAALLKAGARAEGGVAGLSILTLGLVLVMAVVVFLAFPRQSFRLDKTPEAAVPDKALAPEGAPVATAGEQIGIPRQAQFLKLTNFQKLKTDPRPVLRFRATDVQEKLVPIEQIPYLRGAVLETYENGEWRTDFKKQLRKDAADGTVDKWTELERKVPANRTIVRQHILTGALAGDLSFALPDPIRVQWSEARYDPRGVLFFTVQPRQMIEYSVESALMPVEIPPRGTLAPAPAEYLQLPPGLDRVHDIAKRRTEGIGEGRHNRVTQFVQYLRRNGFVYKLDPFVPAQGKDPVEHFLEKREGYCVHYATALALLCRAAGVPARVATGFQLKDMEPDGSFVVKSSDAHAWVEVWYGPDSGWRAYDATPRETHGPAPAPEGPPVASVEDSKNDESKNGPRRWDQFIVDFDPESQSRTFNQGLQAIAGAVGRAARWVFSPLVAGSLAVLCLIAAIVYSMLPRTRRNRLRQIVTGFKESTPVDFYRDFLWTLSRRGIRRHPALTAREFARQIRASIPDEGIDYITERFYEARYRGTPPGPEERARIDAILLRLATADRPAK